MCKVLGVPRSSYYAYSRKKESRRSVENKMFEKKIIEIYNLSKKRYGAPKIHQILLSYNLKISIKRVQRIMKKCNLRSITTKKYRPQSSKLTSDNKQNLIKRDFTTTSINQKWCTDITYIYTQKDKWCYLASVMDLHSKKIIGHSFSKKINTELAVAAVRNAYKTQRPKDKLVLHTDMGCQYTSEGFRKITHEYNILHSFSAKGCPYDNACIESFHAVLKKEEVNNNLYYDFETAKTALFEYIESWYNRKRIHGSINYLTPQQCEDITRKIA